MNDHIYYLNKEYVKTHVSNILSPEEKNTYYINQISKFIPNKTIGNLCPILNVDMPEEKLWCDGLYMHGLTLASLALNYHNFKDEMSLSNIELLIKGLENYFVASGKKGYWLRHFISKDSNEGQNAIVNINNNGFSDVKYWEEKDNHVIWKDVSKDQIYGLVIGMTFCTYYLNSNDEHKNRIDKIKEKIRHLSTYTYLALIDNKYHILNPDNSKPRFSNLSGIYYFLPDVEGLLPTLILAKLSGSDYYDEIYGLFKKLIVKYGPYDFRWFNKTNPNNNFMYCLGNFCLYLLTNGIEFKNNIINQYETFTFRFNNPLYEMIYCICNNKTNEYSKHLINVQMDYFPDNKKIMPIDSMKLIESDLQIEKRKNRYDDYTSIYGLPCCNNVSFFTWTSDLRTISYLYEYSLNGFFNYHWIGSDYIMLFNLHHKYKHIF